MKKQSIAIIGVIALVLAVAVGYALFSETITINGTATASGNFDINFTEVGEVTNSKGYTNVEGNTLAKIEDDGDSLAVSVKNLDYPGAYVEIPVQITNEGTITAELESIEQTGLDETTTPIKVTYSGVATGDKDIEPTDTQNMIIRVEWVESWSETDDEDKNTEVTADFNIKLNYKQQAQ